MLSLDSKKILLTKNVRLDSGHYATKYHMMENFMECRLQIPDTYAGYINGMIKACWLETGRGKHTKICHGITHRGLKLDGAIGQGEICNSLKSEKFSKSFLSHIGKNKIKF
jgi:hypothetical protein